MHKIGLALWRDEQGLVLSAELVFLTSVVAIGMIVGLAAYRDGIVEELADNARAVGQFNQSYSVAIAAAPAAGITVAGNVVTVTQEFGDTDPGVGVTPRVTVVSTFNNFSYTDTADFCEAAVLQRTLAVVDEDDAPPALLP